MTEVHIEFGSIESEFYDRASARSGAAHHEPHGGRLWHGDRHACAESQSDAVVGPIDADKARAHATKKRERFGVAIERESIESVSRFAWRERALLHSEVGFAYGHKKRPRRERGEAGLPG